jgi:hypothetical protein
MSKKPDVRKPAPAAAAKPAAMTDAQALSLLIDLTDRAAMAGAFADLGPQGWGAIKQAKERCAAIAMRLAAEAK